MMYYDTQQQQMTSTSQLNEANNSIHLLKSRVTELEYEIPIAKKIGHRSMKANEDLRPTLNRELYVNVSARLIVHSVIEVFMHE